MLSSKKFCVEKTRPIWRAKNVAILHRARYAHFLTGNRTPARRASVKKRRRSIRCALIRRCRGRTVSQPAPGGISAMREGGLSRAVLASVISGIILMIVGLGFAYV